MGVIDTLALARDQYPGKRNSLDALCERMGVAHAQRTLHGALLDAQLLSEVYLAMTRGQESLTIDVGPVSIAASMAGTTVAHIAIRIILPSDDELAAHHAYLVDLDRASKGACVWLAEQAVTA